MKVLRRSLNKDRISPPSTSSYNGAGANGSNGPSPYPVQPFASLSLASHPGRLAKQAPSKVIRAISSYRARAVTELSFESGDFFHVEGERDANGNVVDAGGPTGVGGGYYEASNPATGARGLVPRSHFQVLGRSARDTPSTAAPGSSSASSTPSLQYQQQQYQQQQQQQPQQSGKGFPFPSTTTNGRSPNGMVLPLPSPGLAGFGSQQGGARTPSGSQTPRSAGIPKNQPLYGIVQYDFAAERNDELDAKKGEPIIVIAQSNHEWFVAKPIGRLGGPGLIPVAFVQVQDVATNKPMPAEKVEDLIRSGTVPRVEDWKKATAAYKGNSIPLGRFDFPSGPQPSPAAQDLSGSASPSSSSSVPRSHARQQSAGGRQVASNYETQTAYLPHHQSSGSHSTPSLASVTPTPPQAQDQRTEAGSDEDNYATVEELRERYGVIVHASVESFHFEQGHYWFHLRAHFSRPMPSDPAKDDITILVLYRLYQDFYDFQIALMDAFPVEAGRVDRDGRALSQAEGAGKRILPMMPGPTDNVDEIVCAQRVQDLSAYLDELARLPFYIRECELVYELLGPREGDVELEGNPTPAGPNATTAAAAEGEVVEYLERMGPSSSRTSAAALPPSSHTSSSSSSQQQQQQTAAKRGPAATAMATAQQQGFLRIKIYQRRTDDLIAIRVPTNVSHPQLLDRVREKVGQNVSTMRFRDEAGDGYSTGGTPPVPTNGGRLVALDNDEDLGRWLDAGSRMVLYAD